MPLLESVFNHLVLPPKIPGQQDTDTEEIEQCILSRLRKACDTLGKFAGKNFQEIWASIDDSLCACMNVTKSRLETTSILKAFQHLQPKHFLVLHVVEQNAALFLRHHVSNGVNTVIFESYEVSPSSEDVLAAENALRWNFPGRAAEISLDEFLNESFQKHLASFLEQASMEPLVRFAAHSVKAKVSVIETRDTINPALITQMLMPLLEAIGSPVDVPRLEKRVRDDVNIDNAELPWRRLPFWLVLRVAIQRHLCITLGNETGQVCYKFLICTVLAQLLDDCHGQLAPELTLMLKSKLCRRLAKLEMDKTQDVSVSAVYKQLFDSISPHFKEIIGKATEHVELIWSNYKKSIARKIPKLPSRANEQDLRLSLPNSERYFFDILNLPRAKRPDPGSLKVPSTNDGAIEQFQSFTNGYFNLAGLERKIELEQKLVPELPADCEARTVELARSIDTLFTAVGSAYDANPEQMSIFILSLFDLWVQMDKCAVRACPLLESYRPSFSPELLDVIHLPTLSDMQRLRDIQVHLKERSRNCRFPNSLFSEPDQTCLAAQYLEQSIPLQNLRQQIETASTRSRENKKIEWTNACENYDKLSEKISAGSCTCSVNLDGSRNIQGCKKCWQRRCQRRMTIEIHEDFLPEDYPLAAAVVFELEIPTYLAAYRNATWRIIGDLAHPSKPTACLPPVMLLKDYDQLHNYLKPAVKGISLASVKKSFLRTHFNEVKMKVNLSNICFPHGPKYSYYDTDSKTWLKGLDRPLTFQHHCGIHVPRGLQFSVIPSSAHPATIIDGPSSYEIIASQTKYPSDMSIHEFMSYQRLLSGKIRRWPTMLVELGASNLNFSIEDTMHVFSQLAVQAGPAQNELDILRDIHLVFRDQSFCQRLVEQIRNRFRNIISNWRETHCMETLITLGLRLFALASGQDRRSAESFLKAVREAILQWIFRLRDELRKASEADAAARFARYGFCAALLCRRTFATFTEVDSKMTADDMFSFVQASVALQENHVVDIEKLPQSLKNMLVRDIKMAYRIQPVIRQTIESNPDCLGHAIDRSWYGSESLAQKTYSPWCFLSSPNDRWVVSTITSKTNEFSISQVVHYNFVEGHLLVDGKTLGVLPRSIRESEDIKELFGNQHLLTFPSSLEGMSHFLATPIPGHQIHVGLRGKDVIIQAFTRDGILEYIPRRVFVNKNSFDLPLGLIENCVHWLHIRSKRLEIRRKVFMWKTKPNDWILDLETRWAQRNKVILVDPHSDLSKRVAEIFLHFEDAQRLTIYQPMRGSLCVELRHLELSFFINRNSLLECRELHAEIDPNQDAGTLYGFKSKIVLRDVINKEQRSIITAFGELTYKRHDMHVAIQAGSTNEYGRFEIDDVLGRLTCPPEPRLIYSKAQFHAFTSFILPDPLTGRSGAEEALHTLRSGYSQPWTTLGNRSVSILRAIGRLSPGKEYYPRDKRSLQTVNWDRRLTMNIQQDQYQALVQEILMKSAKLRAFTLNNKEAIDFSLDNRSHLRRRGEIRRLLYERSMSDPERMMTGNDMEYEPRDRQASSPQAINVYRTVKLIRQRPFKVHMEIDLAVILQKWKLIGGFHDASNSLPSCLTDLIENDFSEQWGSLVDFCRYTDSHDLYRLMFRLGLLSFGTNAEMNAIKSLTAFGCLDELKSLQPPSYSSFVEFKHHEPPKVESLLNMIANQYPIFEPESRWNDAKQDLARERHHIRCEAEGRRLAQFLIEQWPCSESSIEEFKSDVIDVPLILESILPELKRLRRNVELSDYIDRAQNILDRCRGAKDEPVPSVYNPKLEVFSKLNRGDVIPSLPRDILTKRGPDFRDDLTAGGELPAGDLPRDSDSRYKKGEISLATNPSKVVFELGKILDSFTMSHNALRQHYGNDLRESLTALKSSSNHPKLQEWPPSIQALNWSIEEARKKVQEQFENIRNAFSSEDDRFQWLQLGNLWPCTTPITILEQLRSSSEHQFGTHMKENLITGGVQVTTLQRLLRVRNALLKGNQHKSLEEWQNIGHENWSPLDFPDWLLIEIDSDILIRSEQIDVAHAIISPASGSNSVLQMNMGKGKTSCIVPMATAILANKKQLSRLIVPKALLLQTAQTVQSRLGGLVGREIRHVPFSRRTPTTPIMLRSYSDLHCEMHRRCGIILATPEHILSYKLSGLQRLADLRIKEAQNMIEFQSWLTRTCRDVLDESDFTLAVKTQLIYPSGPQTSVDGHPYRWEVAQMLLALVEDHLPKLQRDFPQSIEVFKRPHGFPMVCFLHTDVEEALHGYLIDDICDGRTSRLRLANSISPMNRIEIKRVLSEENVDLELIKQVSWFFADKFSSFKKILLIRGLLLNKILLLCLKKRWNVQYGLHPERDPIAVPFEAKGVPSQQAEFGHPDVAIIFTCLAFYHAGLNFSQLTECLRYLLRSDDPAAEYDRWTCGSDTLPEALHHWNVINVDDQGQVEELWRYLRFNRNILDCYMNNFVFPFHAKQFGVKLQASGWDLPLFSKRRPEQQGTTCTMTTGFSGTNDNKMMLPLNIKQDDLPSLRQINAEVLTYLLQERNREYHLAVLQKQRMTEEDLLRRIAAMGIRILIDAGAFILEMDNRSLVKLWLSIDTKAKAAIYFENDNGAWVQYQRGKERVPLLATPFAENFDECLVYLDEAHTRGVDLKLPQNARGALTLALGQTKDHTVQAAMRLRQLGTTQSVVFFAPPEVHQSILDVCKRKQGDIIDSSHVIHWLLEQTCCANEQMKNLYIAQGIDFCRRTNAQYEHAKFLTDKNQRTAYLQNIQYPDRQTLEQLYGGMFDAQPGSLGDLSSTKLNNFLKQLLDQKRAAKGSRVAIHGSALEEVEQEREVESQLEAVRQVQKPTHYEALVFPGLHAAVARFATNGDLDGEQGYEYASTALRRTKIGQQYQIKSKTSRLFVSAEFMRTIQLDSRGSNDDFLRPVEWILWNPSNETALIVIPEEAELLIPMIRLQEKPNVNMMAYAAPVTKNMLHFNGLLYYVIPSLPIGYAVPDWLSIELGIFAGRLYMNFAECAALKGYLRLEDTSNLQSSSSEHVGDIFAKNHINFLLDWLTLRRKGHDIMHTPMGYVCQGRLLHPNHPFFADRSTNAGDAVGGTSTGGQGTGVKLKEAEEGGGEEWGGEDGEDVEEEEETDLEDEWDPISQRKIT